MRVFKATKLEPDLQDNSKPVEVGAVIISMDNIMYIQTTKFENSNIYVVYMSNDIYPLYVTSDYLDEIFKVAL